MADADDAQKTEDPTPKRLRDARSEGQVPLSREVNHWLLLLVATLAIALLGGLVARGMSAPLAGIMEKAGELAIAEKEVGELLADVVRELGGVFAWPALAIVFIALFSPLAQIVLCLRRSGCSRS